MKYPLLLRRYIKNDKFKEWVDAYGKSNTIYFHEYGEENPDINIYYIKLDSSALGFFAYWKMAIIGINYAKFYNLYPVINWTKSCPYYESTLFGVESNPFEYYFEPISKLSIKSIEHSKSVVIADINKDQIGVFAKALAYDFSNQIEDYVKIHKEYFHIRTELASNMEAQIGALFCGKKVLGVHIRGVEWGTIKNHPIPVSIEKYYEWIDLSVKENSFERIFIATDSEETITKCRNRYGSMMVTFDDVLRTKIGSRTLMIYDESIQRKNNHYLMGYEVLRDVLALSKCAGLIAGFSNVALAARVFKESEKEKYEFLKIIEPNAICERGISVSKAVKQMKQGKFDRKEK